MNVTLSFLPSQRFKTATIKLSRSDNNPIPVALSHLELEWVHFFEPRACLIGSWAEPEPCNAGMSSLISQNKTEIELAEYQASMSFLNLGSGSSKHRNCEPTIVVRPSSLSQYRSSSSLLFWVEFWDKLMFLFFDSNLVSELYRRPILRTGDQIAWPSRETTSVSICIGPIWCISKLI